MPRQRSPIGRIVTWGDGQQFIKVGQPDDWAHYTSGGKYDKKSASKSMGDVPPAEELENCKTFGYAIKCGEVWKQLTPLALKCRERMARKAMEGGYGTDEGSLEDGSALRVQSLDRKTKKLHP